MSDTSISNSASAPVYTPPSAGRFTDADTQTMSAEDILNYVHRALGNIDAQMVNYRDLVKARQQKAAELREALALMNSMKEGGKIHHDNVSAEDYDRMMTLLAKNSDIPSVKAAYDKFLESYGGFTPTESFKTEDGTELTAGNRHGADGPPDTAGESGWNAEGEPIENWEVKPSKQDRILGKDETQSVLDNTREGLESLNTENEMIMLDLKKLFDQRNQISQFASGALNADHEAKKAVIANIR